MIPNKKEILKEDDKNYVISEIISIFTLNSVSKTNKKMNDIVINQSEFENDTSEFDQYFSNPSFENNNINNNINLELNEYEKEEKMIINICEYWELNRYRFKSLFKIFKIIKSIDCCNSGIERSFSIAKILVD